MNACIANKEADSKVKDEQRRWEPIKAMSAAFAAGVSFASAFIALVTWVLSRFVLPH